MPERMDFWEALYSRRSVREFKPDPIEDWKLERILDVARWAPSPENVQNWRYVVIKDPEIKKLLGELGKIHAAAHFGEPPYELLESRLWYLPEEIKHEVIEMYYDGSLFDYCAEAPVNILCLCAEGHYDMPEQTRSSWMGHLGGTGPMMMGVLNMWLAATALGLGAAFNVFPVLNMRDQEYLSHLLGIPHSWSIYGVFCLGYPAKEWEIPPSRHPIEAIAFNERWGKPWVRAELRDPPELPDEPLPKKDVFEVIYERRSIREYKLEDGKPVRVPDWKIERILDAARWTPSFMNIQPWRFIIVRDPELKEWMAKTGVETSAAAFGEVPTYEFTDERIWYIPKRARPGVLERQYDGRLFDYCGECDVVMICCHSTEQHQDLSGSAPGMTLWNEPYSTWGPQMMAVQAMWLAATALNLGAGFNTFPVVGVGNNELITELLGIPPSWRVTYTLNIGVPAYARMLGPSRYPLEAVAFVERWGKPYIREPITRE